MKIKHAILMLSIVSGLFQSITLAHDHRPCWVDEPVSLLGTMLIIEHSRVVRGPGDPRLTVRIGFFNDATGTSLEGIRIETEDTLIAAMDAKTPLAPLGASRQRAIDALATMEFAIEKQDRKLVEVASNTLHAANAIIQAGMVTHRWILDRSILDVPLRVNVFIRHGDRLEQLTRTILVPQAPALPEGLAPAHRFRIDASGQLHDLGYAQQDRGTTPWLAGDQHLHSKWSLDANVLNGTEDGVTEYADTARLVGLDWAFITDHSNIHINWFGEEFFTPEQHAEARAEAASYRENEGWPVGYSQEMGVGSTGFWNLPSHMLAYPLQSFDTALIENPSSGLVFGHANCEDEQVIIDRILENGCFGFIAHPFKSGTLTYAEWDWNNGATGWAGLELWSDEEAHYTDAEVQAMAVWHELLQQIEPPAMGELPSRPDFPTRFPVGVGNSDAHELGFVGSVFTYAPLDAVHPDALRGAFLGGHCVVSNGPLLTLRVNTAGIGNVGLLPDGNGLAEVRLELTSEFGLVSDYTIDLFSDGVFLMTLPTEGVDDAVAEFMVSTLDAFGESSYLTAVATSADDAYRSLTNPVWLQVTEPGDANGDSSVNVKDVLIVIDTWGPCDGCPSDFDGNGDVDSNDILILLANWGTWG
ncbi:MAG: hypothetical protein VX527_09035 [Planctomycetota bacterium]|nr:hypothetical protein [Planctomycetota bacterium]